ncbi:phosphotransferase [Dongia deserti]|uniref:phosphotransferase n=1 Tax=Dongia deserti TaxID=2268030 RepID=UPI000E657ED5|nr:phosphotransferase [Dongia deserti]
MAAVDVARHLPCWKGRVEPKPIKGGITNANFLVEDAGQRYFVRVGEDIPIHGVMRFNECAASRAAAACGLSPELLYEAPGALVFRYIEAKTLSAEDVCPRPMLERILPMLRTCHRDIPKQVRGPVLIFWVFHVVRDYVHTLKAGNSAHLADVPYLLRMAQDLEQAVGPVEIVFGHNDLLPTNFLDDGKRLWLIDWDYAGFNSPLFDLANLASNNEVAEPDERWLLETYFERPLTPQLWRSYRAMKCASLLRETMWSMVQEIHSELDFDYPAYTADYRSRLERMYASFRKE